jgi:hypothetical protein
LHVTENGCEPFSMYPGKYVVKGGRPASAKRVKVSKAKAKAKPKAKSKPKAKAKSRAKKR